MSYSRRPRRTRLSTTPTQTDYPAPELNVSALGLLQRQVLATRPVHGSELFGMAPSCFSLACWFFSTVRFPAETSGPARPGPFCRLYISCISSLFFKIKSSRPHHVEWVNVVRNQSDGHWYGQTQMRLLAEDKYLKFPTRKISPWINSAQTGLAQPFFIPTQPVWLSG